MFYEKSITESSGGSVGNKTRTRIPITAGIIVKGEIQFPNGCAGLVNVQVRHGNHQLWPLNREESIKGDGVIVFISEHYEIKRAEDYLDIMTWNTDDTYDHTVTVRITVLPKKVAQPWSVFEDIIGTLARFIGRNE